MSRFFAKFSRAGLLMIVFGAILLVQSTPDFVTSFKTPKDFEEVLENGAVPGDRVQGQVLFLLDTFAIEESWTENRNGGRTPKKTSNYYYVLPAGEDFVGLTVHPNDAEAATDLVEQTYEFLSDGPEPTAVLEVDARVSEMEADLVSLFEDDMRDYYDYSDHDLSVMKPYLMVEPRNFTAVRVLCIAGAVLLVLGVLVFVRRWQKYSHLETQESWEA